MNRVKGKWQKLRRQVTKSKTSEGDTTGKDDDPTASVATSPVTPTPSAPSRWQKLIEQLQEEERLRSLATRDVSESNTSISPSSPAGDGPTVDTAGAVVTARHVAESRDNNTRLSDGETPDFPKMSQVKGRWMKLRKQVTADIARERDSGRDSVPADDTPASNAREPSRIASEQPLTNRLKHDNSELTTNSTRKQQSSITNVCNDTKENIVPKGKQIDQSKFVSNGNLVPNGKRTTQDDSLAGTCCSAEPRKTTSVKGRWLKLKTRVTVANMAVQQLQQVRTQAVERDCACAHGDVTEVLAEKANDNVSASQQIVSDRTYRAAKNRARARKPKQVSWSHSHPTFALIPHHGQQPRVPIIARRSLAKTRASFPFVRSSSVSSGYSSIHQLSPDGSDVMDDDVFGLDAVERVQTNSKWANVFESSRQLQAAV